MVARRRSLPLWRSVSPKVYVVDTSSWLNIELRADSEDVWRRIVDLIEAGRIVAPAQVLAELRRNPMYDERIRPYEAALQAGDIGSDDPEYIDYLMYVGQITHNYPSMAKATGEKTPADPYVIALAEREGYVVVADESTKRPSRKIPGVCKDRKTPCITLDQFLEETK